MLLDGPHLVGEAFASGLHIDTIAFGERHLPGRFDTLAARAAADDARTVVVTEEVLAAMSPVQQPAGVVAIARRRPASLEEVFARQPQLVLLIAEIQDPGNVGAIIRAAEACGATGVVPGEATADPLGWKALRGGMGSTFRLPVATRQPLEDVAVRARADGLRLLSTVPRGGTPLPDCDLRSPSAILLGGEGPGLPDTLVRVADGHITIPMRPPVESLNVAIAAALVLYEAARQRGGPPPLPRPRGAGSAQ
ncbi:MAG TPA: RNA methyltransferase [Thermohalobaculum sp.]|nr:RNA methyltransferase [Thermohalobaculum sp.]